MNRIVTDISQLGCHLSSRGYLNIEILLDNEYNHPALAEVVAVYIEDHLNSYIVNISHPDTSQVNIDGLKGYLEKWGFGGWTRNYVATKHIFPNNNIHDLNLLYYFNNNKGLPELKNPPIYSFIYNKHKTNHNNRFIPIEMHLKRFDDLIFEQARVDIFDEGNVDELISIDTLAETYYKLAMSPLGVLGKKDLYNHTNDRVINHNVKDGLMYPLYKPTSVTSRPVCNFNGLSVSSLSKKDNKRSFIIPTNDHLMELDYDGFHPRILGNLIDYNFPKDKSLHKEMAKLYFGESTDENYIQAKELTFQQLYGGVMAEYEHIEYFKLSQEYAEKIEQIYYAGELKTPFFKRPLTPKNLGDLGRQKLLNYYIQAYETEHNVLVLEDIFDYLEDKKSRLILYNYDAFLFDIDVSEDVVGDLKNIVSKTFPVHEKTGRDYASLG